MVVSRVTVRSYDDLPLGEQTVAHVQAKLQVRPFHRQIVQIVQTVQIVQIEQIVQIVQPQPFTIQHSKLIPPPGESGTGNIAVTIGQGATEVVSPQVNVISPEVKVLSSKVKVLA